MYAYEDVQSLIANSFCPVIAVESSKSAEQTCREANLSVIQLLR